MNVFRSAVEARDADSKEDLTDGGDKVLSTRVIERREGTNFETLKRFLLADLANLMSTVHMEAVEDLDAFPNVRQSILNYGVQDVTKLTREDTRKGDIRKQLKQALLDHEPRLIADTVNVRIQEYQDDTRHTVAFEVEAVMAARPVDVPLEFVAQIDSAEGKVQLAKLSVRE